MSDKIIYTSYFGKMRKINKEYSNPVYLSVVRYITESLKSYLDETIHDFAPSNKLLLEYKEGILTEEKFKEFYTNDLEKVDITIFKEIIKKYDKRPMFLLCYEKSEHFCHRHILREYLNKKLDLNITEYDT